MQVKLLNCRIAELMYCYIVEKRDYHIPQSG